MIHGCLNGSKSCTKNEAMDMDIPNYMYMSKVNIEIRLTNGLPQDAVPVQRVREGVLRALRVPQTRPHAQGEAGRPRLRPNRGR